MSEAKARRVVLVMTDSQRWDMVGCYGNAAMNTPNLDGLAADGVRFDRAYCCQPVCGPARAGLFTGLWPHACGSWANSMPLGANVRTIGQRLRDEGIHTAYIGKWHLDGGDYFGLGRCPDGWDGEYWYDMRRYLEELSPEDRVRSRQSATSFDEGLTEDFTFGHRCSTRAIDFLSRHHADDFLLVVSYDEPHGPCLCPRPFAEMFQGYEFPRSRNISDRLAGKGEHQRVWAGPMLHRKADEVKDDWSLYFGCNAFVDHEIGRVLAAIERYAPDALVIYTSDHGEALGSHSLYGKGPAMYDEIARVPLIVRWPGVSPAGSVCPHPASHIDIAPTILAAMGLPRPTTVDGRDMLATLCFPLTPTCDTVFMEFSRYEVDHDGFGGFQPVRAAFDGRYKLVVNLLSGDELYDVQSDPEEMANRIDAQDCQAARDRLHEAMLDWMNRTRDPFRGYYWERRPWRTDARGATWEYTGMTRQREDEREGRQLDYGTGLEIKEAVRRK